MKNARAVGDPAPRGPHEGVALVGVSSRLIGADERASAILRAVSGADEGDCASAAAPVLPPTLRARLTQDMTCPTRQSIRFRVGARTYLARVFPLKDPEGRELQSRFILLLSEEATPEQSLSDRYVRYGLTAREVDVLNGIAMGLTSKEIAARLGISTPTVKCFTRLILIKTGARSRAGILATLLNASEQDAAANGADS